MTFVEQCREVYEQWRRKGAILFTILFTCLTAYHVIFGANGWVVYQQKKADFHHLQDDQQKLSKENELLQKDVKALKTDKAAIEREAREQLHYTRPGEVIFVTPVKAAPESSVALKR